MENIINNIKAISNTTKLLIVSGIAVALFAGIILIVFSGSGEVSIDIETALKEVIVSSQFRTAEYTYNSIAEVKENETTKYYVSYKGTVTAGFSFDKVNIIREGNTIKVIVPDMEILEVIVEPTLDYIFMENKYDTETTYSEATKACKEDLQAKAKTNESLLRTAREGAEDTLKALMKPFEGQLQEGESFVIVFTNDEEGHER